MPEIAYVNGEFLPLDRATVHVEDRGFQFADAVYEVLRVYAGQIFAINAHLERLFRSLEAIDLQHGFTTGQLRSRKPPAAPASPRRWSISRSPAAAPRVTGPCRPG